MSEDTIAILQKIIIDQQNFISRLLEANITNTVQLMPVVGHLMNKTMNIATGKTD